MANRLFYVISQACVLGFDALSNDLFRRLFTELDTRSVCLRLVAGAKVRGSDIVVLGYDHDVKRSPALDQLL